mgnify:CR=1 FL=1
MAMRTTPCDQATMPGELSDEAVVEILDFLQRFMTDFENRYARQINRYYKQRSRPNAISRAPGVAPQDEPF